MFLTPLSHRPFDPTVQSRLREPREDQVDFPALLAPDPLIQQMVNRVSPTKIDQYWYDLVNNLPSGTRFTFSSGCRNAAVYCHDQLEKMKVPAEYQGYGSDLAPNVIGTHVGAITPERVYIVIGHLDDMPLTGTAPGADDNASGSVTVLESARVLSCYAFRSTIKFITCPGEELGLWGSEAYAADAQARGEDIRGVLNFDMNGWEGNGSPNPENLDLDYNAASEDLALVFQQSASDYHTGLAVDAFLCPDMSASDHYPFWSRGVQSRLRHHGQRGLLRPRGKLSLLPRPQGHDRQLRGRKVLPLDHQSDRGHPGHSGRTVQDHLHQLVRRL